MNENEVVQQKSLKILVIFNSLLGVIGGGSRHIVEVVDHWTASNQVDYLISESGYKVAKNHIEKNYSPNKGVIVYSTPFDNVRFFFLSYISRTIKSILMSHKLKEKYDIVIAPNYLPQNMIPAIFLKEKNTKLTVYFHTTQPNLRKQYLATTNIFRRLISKINWKICLILAKRFYDIVFVVNKPTREYFISNGFLSNSVFVIRNGIPYKQIASINPPEKEYTGVFLGRLVENKGIFDLIEIWQIVTKKYPFAKLCIIGDGPEKKNLKIKIEESGIGQNIILTGQAEGDTKYQLMKKSKIFVYPSYYESQGVVILEALACKLPVVVYNLDTYEEFYDGYIFTASFGDINKMAEIIIDIISNPQKFENITEEAKNIVSKYDWKETANNQEYAIRNLFN